MEEKSQELMVAQAGLIKAQQEAEFAMTPVGQMVKQFETYQRMAKMFCTSTIVPAQYQGENNIGNCVIAIEMANRMHVMPLMVMQNLTIVKGNPTWSSKFLIATINACGRFTPIDYEFVGKEGTDSYGCRCYTYASSDKERKKPLYGTTITIAMAKKEGWYSKKDKNGNETSKWQSMPEQMLRYRAAAFWQRVYAPEIGMGFLTTEEVQDVDEQIQPDYRSVEQEIHEEANKQVIDMAQMSAEANNKAEEKQAKEPDFMQD